MHTTHWTWESEPVTVPWRDEPVTIGKKNQINNFCIGTQGNERTCMSCHAGYGWSDAEFDFSEPSNVDCLVCHADVSTYGKGDYGLPAEDVDLLAAAQSVRAPTRDNCGKCHFDGGGGNNVKHGDLDESLYFPSGELDVHMGANDFLCTDCHQTEEHDIKGKLLADNYTIDATQQVACTDCHALRPARGRPHQPACGDRGLPDLPRPLHGAQEPHQDRLGLVDCRAGFARGSLQLSQDQGQLCL